MEDRRKATRKDLKFFSQVYERESSSLFGYLSNLTPEGAMIISEWPIETEAFFRLYMDLPEGFASKTVLNFDAQSVWCRMDGDSGFYRTGFRLLRLSEEDHELLERMVQEYGLHD
jgi:hypothetical protein